MPPGILAKTSVAHQLHEGDIVFALTFLSPPPQPSRNHNRYTVFYAIGWAVFYGRLGHQIGSMRTNWLSFFAYILYGFLHPLTFGAAFCK